MFSYESVLDSKNKNWRIAAEIPLAGEELIELNWAHGMKIKAQALKADEQKQIARQLGTLEKFLKLFATRESWNCERNDDRLNCRNGQEKMTLDLLADGYQINLADWKISLTQLNQQNFFEKMILQGQNDSISWYFFVSSCQ